MTRKTTKGPWEVRGKDSVYGPRESISGEYSIGSYCLAECLGYKDEREANARLIAAAPEMLDVLKMLKRHGYANEVRKAINSAIAKAEGKER